MAAPLCETTGRVESQQGQRCEQSLLGLTLIPIYRDVCVAATAHNSMFSLLRVGLRVNPIYQAMDSSTTHHS